MGYGIGLVSVFAAGLLSSDAAAGAGWEGCPEGTSEVVHQGTEQPPWPWTVRWDPIWETRDLSPLPRLETSAAGTVRWCVRPDGVRQGPYLAEVRDLGTMTGRYVDGLPDGPWRQRGGAGRQAWIRKWRMRRGTGTMDWADRSGEPMVRIRYRDGVPDGPFVTWVEGQWLTRGRFEEGRAEGVWLARLSRRLVEPPLLPTHRVRFEGGRRSGEASGEMDGIEASGSFVDDRADGLWRFRIVGQTAVLYEAWLRAGSGAVPVRSVLPDASGRHAARYLTVLEDGRVTGLPIDPADEASLPRIAGQPSAFTLAGSVLGGVRVGQRSWCEGSAGHRIPLAGAGQRELTLDRGEAPGLCAGAPPAPDDPCARVPFQGWHDALRAELEALGSLVGGPGIGACDPWQQPGVEHTSVSIYDWRDADAVVRTVAASMEAWGLRGPVEVRVHPIPRASW